LNQYITNLKNMWSTKTRTNKLFGPLLDVLLWINLVPTRKSKHMSQRRKMII
ncbi:hypothetical protein K501DRAFT_177396, partial [Backusella circina FSU 941]